MVFSFICASVCKGTAYKVDKELSEVYSLGSKPAAALRGRDLMCFNDVLRIYEVVDKASDRIEQKNRCHLEEHCEPGLFTMEFHHSDQL